ncbi:cell envelope integrity EipB family protein [Bosea sp. (in: a-proteobacteria)]|uniref:cell envelope integrity EipB family protein n=1 Tax=Bosea sp. (in: a-proteobacteria) TaxID=1871050 RepID=UPI0027349466|nr:cell envelope integrity EipB family protein [Bosea sp. (in: a-proteobacteria)]MDP3409072.1 cell envelope integrity EipB family protein [Bosea sp. (in: a-proteobacteria)]
MTTNAPGLAGLIAVAVLCSGAALAQPQSADRVVLVPHRAVYDLVLDGGKASKNVESARGRIAFDFTGDACDGYALSFRQVTQLQSGEGGPRVIDARTTSFEAGDGASYRFKTESSASGTPTETVDGIATRKDGGYEVKLTVPKPETHREAVAALFPNAQMKAVIQAARAGQTTLSVRLYDGANGGKDVYETLSVIGRKIEAKPSETPLQRPEFESLARWPVTMSYFKVGSGETTPSYTISFELYENGVTGAVRLDYGSFALRGTLTRLDLLPQAACAK